jgi:hypothetical protein
VESRPSADAFSIPTTLRKKNKRSVSLHAASVNYSVRKAGHKEATNSWFNFGTGKAKSCGSPNSSVQVIEKLYTQPTSLFVVPGNSIIAALIVKATGVKLFSLRRHVRLTAKPKYEGASS